MDKKKLLRKALEAADDSRTLYEGFGYPEGMTERIEQGLEKRIMDRKTAIGDHPALPKGGVRGFDQRLLLDRFLEVVNRYKDAFDLTEIDNKQAIETQPKLLMDVMKTEQPHTKGLEELAVRMIYDEFDIDEDSMDIEARLVESVSLDSKIKNINSDEEFKMEFENHEAIENAELEVNNRRFINCMIQGAAMRCNHMFNMKNKELMEFDPRLPSKYKKLMAGADYMYFIMPDTVTKSADVKNTIGGMVDVDYDEGDKPKIVAEALTLPVLIHELVKGVMEVIAAHGFGDDEALNEYVVSQADFLAAESDDMIMGPAIMGRFMEAIDPKDSNYKHHLFYQLIKKPTKEFNECMREILAGTKAGKKLVSEIIDGVKSRIEVDELTEDETIEAEQDFGAHINRSREEMEDLHNRLNQAEEDELRSLFGDGDSTI